MGEGGVVEVGFRDLEDEVEGVEDHGTCDANAHCPLQESAGPRACTVIPSVAKSPALPLH